MLSMWSTSSSRAARRPVVPDPITSEISKGRLHAGLFLCPIPPKIPWNGIWALELPGIGFVRSFFVFHDWPLLLSDRRGPAARAAHEMGLGGKTNPIFGFVRNRSGERHSYATQLDMTFGAGENWVRFIIFRGSHSCCLSSLPSGPVLVDRTREAVSGRKCRMRVSIYKGGQLRSTAKLW